MDLIPIGHYSWSCWGIYDALQAFLNAILRRFTLSPICTKFSSLFDLQTQTQINNTQLMSWECKKCILLSSCLYVLDEFAIFATYVSSMPSLIIHDHCTKHDNMIKYISIQCNLIRMLQCNLKLRHDTFKKSVKPKNFRRRI